MATMWADSSGERRGAPSPALRQRRERTNVVAMTTIVVGTDLTERSRPAIIRGVTLARHNGAQLLVCHARHKALPVNPLFPHEAARNIAATVVDEQRIADAVTRQVVETTGFTAFNVVVDIGDPAQVICAQATKHRADLVVVTADRPNVGAVARDLSTSPCSVLVVGPSTGDVAAILMLESEVSSIGTLVDAARKVSIGPVSKFVVILWADSEEKKAPLLAELERTSRALGVQFEPWFADLADPSAMGRAAKDPGIGLIAMMAPRPDKIVERRASPLDDGFEGAATSFLLLRGNAA
jgi:nucleotide-binding universal stress UspA family protein